MKTLEELAGEIPAHVTQQVEMMDGIANYIRDNTPDPTAALLELGFSTERAEAILMGCADLKLSELSRLTPLFREASTKAMAESLGRFVRETERGR